VRIAVFGDIHGHWISFRDTVLRLHGEAPLDLVLQVGDAQPIRNELDSAYMPVPERYRALGEYALIQDPWPVPTLFIGGNHEPWNVLEALPEGGYLQPNLEYLGRSGLRTFGPLRIAGLSGVHSPRAIDNPRQRWPFPPAQARDASYYRREDLKRLARLAPLDVLLLHEWPPQMEDARKLDWPRHWERVGSEPLGQLVSTLKPRFVFCGHMHCPAQVQVGPSTLVALDDFGSRPDQAVAVLEGCPLALRP
jgi:hypothetical protein